MSVVMETAHLMTSPGYRSCLPGDWLTAAWPSFDAYAFPMMPDCAGGDINGDFDVGQSASAVALDLTTTSLAGTFSMASIYRRA